MSMEEIIKSASLAELKELKNKIEGEILNRKQPANPISSLRTYTDGASRGNPGHAGIGAALFNEHDQKIKEESRYIGITTNNEAEYRALILALELAQTLTRDRVDCYMDSQLLVRQLNGQYAVKSEKMIALNAEVRRQANQFSRVTFTHLPREDEKMRIADRLANRGIDQGKPR